MVADEVQQQLLQADGGRTQDRAQHPLMVQGRWQQLFAPRAGGSSSEACSPAPRSSRQCSRHPQQLQLRGSRRPRCSWWAGSCLSQPMSRHAAN